MLPTATAPTGPAICVWHLLQVRGVPPGQYPMAPFLREQFNTQDLVSGKVGGAGSSVLK